MIKRDMMKIRANNLYLIITEEYGRGRSVSEIAESAIAGGVDMIQLREKSKSLRRIIKTAKLLKDFCERSGTAFIVNDDPLLARDIDADGVHLGQEDMKHFTVHDARKLLGKKKIIGVSASSIEEVRKANTEEIDYIGFGPVFPTTVKEGCLGVKCIQKILAASKKPIFFIGGINLTNIDELLDRGASNVAVIRAISEADDIKSAVETFKKKLRGSRHGKIA